MKHIVKVISITKAANNVLCIVTEKPSDFEFIPGQATKISINRSGWIDDAKPFTFTCIPENDYLEFVIKIYQGRRKVTNQIQYLEVGDELILHQVFGSITFQGDGVFIAGGAGVTPFISILRALNSKGKLGDNKLIFANKSKIDIINEKEFKSLLGDNFIPVLSEEKISGYVHGLINSDLIKESCTLMNTIFYVCGPPPMIDSVEQILKSLGVFKKSIVKESF
jgi:ferredoxin-NADP reductase